MARGWFTVAAQPLAAQLGTSFLIKAIGACPALKLGNDNITITIRPDTKWIAPFAATADIDIIVRIEDQVTQIEDSRQHHIFSGSLLKS